MNTAKQFFKLQRQSNTKQIETDCPERLQSIRSWRYSKLHSLLPLPYSTAVNASCRFPRLLLETGKAHLWQQGQDQPTPPQLSAEQDSWLCSLTCSHDFSYSPHNLALERQAWRPIPNSKFTIDLYLPSSNSASHRSHGKPETWNSQSPSNHRVHGHWVLCVHSNLTVRDTVASRQLRINFSLKEKDEVNLVGRQWINFLLNHH